MSEQNSSKKDKIFNKNSVWILVLFAFFIVKGISQYYNNHAAVKTVIDAMPNAAVKLHSLSQEEQNKIYEAFYRGNNINMRQGLGLGLSIANVALKKLNGSIVLSSKVGTGSIFKVEIPLLDDSVAKEQLT